MTDPLTPKIGAFGKGVRSLRSSRGWSQQELADRAALRSGKKWAQSKVTKIEYGQQDISLEDALLLAALFDVPLDGMFVVGAQEALVQELQTHNEVLLALDAELADLARRQFLTRKTILVLRQELGDRLAQETDTAPLQLDAHEVIDVVLEPANAQRNRPQRSAIDYDTLVSGLSERLR